MNGPRNLRDDGDRKPSMSVCEVQTHLEPRRLAAAAMNGPGQETGSNKQQKRPFIKILCG